MISIYFASGVILGALMFAIFILSAAGGGKSKSSSGNGGVFTSDKIKNLYFNA